MPVEALRGIPWTLVTYAATRVVTLLTTLVLARLLAPADFGVFAMATLSMELLSVFSGLWLGAALIVRRGMDARAQGTVLTLLLGSGALLALVLLALAPALAAFFGEPRLAGIVALLAAVLLVSGVNWFYETVLQRELAFRRRFACQLVRALTFAGVALVLAILGTGVWSLIVAYLAGQLANGAALLALTPYRVRPAFDREEAGRIVRDGRGFLGQDLAGFVSENADYLAVGRLLGPAQLGFYAMAFRQASLPHHAIAEPVAKVTFPAFAQMRRDGKDVREAFLNVVRMVALASCPAGVILSAAAVPFTVALLGDDWRPMAGPLAVLGAWAVLRPLQLTVGNLLNSLGRAEIYGRVALVSLLPLVVCTFAAAALGGITAVAWVLLVHMTLTFAVVAVVTCRAARVAVRSFAAALLPLAAASAVAWVATRAAATLFSELGAGIALAAATGACLASYLATLAVLDRALLNGAMDGARRAIGRPVGAAPKWRGRRALPGLAIAAAAAIGIAAALQPRMAVALVGGALLLALPFVAPVAHLTLLLLVTTIVPFDVQNALAFGGGPGSPGLLPSDVLLVGGLARAVLVLLDTRLERRTRWMLAGLVALLGLAVLQAFHGVRAGYDAGTTGAELRVLLGFGAAIIAVPLLRDPAARARLSAGLLVVGLAVGAWGLVQWTVELPFTAAQDAGVRAGVRFTTEGRGQIQGGLFAFPVAVVMGVAALLSHEVRSLRIRGLLVAIVALNTVDLLRTYERTFWVATAVALAFLALRATPAQRMRALALGPALVAVALVGMALAAPRDLAAARERLASLVEFSSDLSVRYRVTETRTVIRAIEERPVAGAGLGAAILWGRPYEGVRPTTETFAHNGYLWLVWKLGAPAAALLVVLLVAAVLSRGPPATTTAGALRAGGQAGLLLLLIASVTFPAFNALGITAAMGVLVALCAAPRAGSATA
ncbi:MAG TPA: oligosaccharide flippase family protein [Solirubrobacteraceae bacterium]|jgi:O-antigen/teichoic acid export membrane protein|nr:oligosaccharide flippase family protein [Solirubrobacteraceae bacterium]